MNISEDFSEWRDCADATYLVGLALGLYSEQDNASIVTSVSNRIGNLAITVLGEMVRIGNLEFNEELGAYRWNKAYRFKERIGDLIE
ncbi:hypothetical protein [Verrucomicrobium sp. BvORR034]|uniref:hypothetical protein n=1 Tax=Verrucomicrobium sp. BvORR034 TaxID=1396418 RepID=UPI000678D0DF|nr:hypothetical protein [Verrucomicrobium sp. BvORR034]